MSSTPALPKTPRLSAAQPAERVPTQNLDSSEPAKAKVQEQWENRLFECCKPSPGRFFYTLFCPCLVYGRTWARLKKISAPQLLYDKHINDGCALFCFFTCIYLKLGSSGMAIDQRYQVRKELNIPGHVCMDILEGTCCTPCALIQAEKEMAGRDKKKSKAEERQYVKDGEKMEMRRVQETAPKQESIRHIDVSAKSTVVASTHS